MQNITDALPGKERMSVAAAEAGARLVRDLRKVTPYVEYAPDPVELREAGQLGLGDW